MASDLRWLAGMAALESPRPMDWRALHRRWWIEYDPLALLSAALVLAGLTVLSGEATFDGSSSLLLSAVAEVYALCLIGGAAFLFRLHRRRAAVILALLAVLFQGDLTLHVETSAYLDEVGVVAAPAWFLIFALKLQALAWALQLRLARSTFLVALLGAAGLAALPPVLRTLGSDAGSPWVTGWLFGLGAAGLWTERSVTSAVPMDDRARRALRFTWLVWAVAALAHAGHWVAALRLDVSVWPAAAALLAMRFARRESQHWMLAAGALAATALQCPANLTAVAALAATTLALVGLRTPPRRLVQGAPERPGPYREPLRTTAPQLVVDDRARARLLVGSAVAAYLAIWTSGDAPRWGALPGHPVWAVVLLTLGLGVWAERRSHPGWLAPLAPLYAHLLVQVGWLRLPIGALEWGATLTVVGFAALAGALFVQLRARDARQGGGEQEL